MYVLLTAFYFNRIEPNLGNMSKITSNIELTTIRSYFVIALEYP